MRIKKNNLILIFLVVLGLLIFLHGVGLLRPLENFILKSFSSLNSRFYSWGNSFQTSYQEQATQESLLAKIDELTKEVAVLTVASSQEQELREENAKLRSQLNFVKTNNFKAVAAEVISRESLIESSGAGQDIIINKGLKDGLAVGQGVTSEEGIIIGKIVEVKDHSAKLCLTTSCGCKLAAAIQNSTRTQGITDGDLGLTIKMNYIPQLEVVSVGDRVITSGLGDKIPRGLVIGKVIEIRNESNEVWQDATIEPLVNLDNLTVVTVIIP